MTKTFHDEIVDALNANNKETNIKLAEQDKELKEIKITLDNLFTLNKINNEYLSYIVGEKIKEKDIE